MKHSTLPLLKPANLKELSRLAMSLVESSFPSWEEIVAAGGCAICGNKEDMIFVPCMKPRAKQHLRQYMCRKCPRLIDACVNLGSRSLSPDKVNDSIGEGEALLKHLKEYRPDLTVDQLRTAYSIWLDQEAFIRERRF